MLATPKRVGLQAVAQKRMKHHRSGWRSIAPVSRASEATNFGILLIRSAKPAHR
jgi:hypothetical protein